MSEANRNPTNEQELNAGELEEVAGGLNNKNPDLTRHEPAIKAPQPAEKPTAWTDDNGAPSQLG